MSCVCLLENICYCLYVHLGLCTYYELCFGLYLVANSMVGCRRKKDYVKYCNLCLNLFGVHADYVIGFIESCALRTFQHLIWCTR
jgi:hypothetical protein